MRSPRAVCLSLLCLGLLGSGFAACAGSERPEPTAEQEAQITALYVNGGAAGASAGGSANANAGAAGDGPSGGAGGGDGECNAFEILEQRCSGGGCHGADSDLGDFAASLEAAEAFAGAAPVTADCLDEDLVIDPENPTQSLLVQKVSGAPPCGGSMPLVPPALTDDEVACLVEWIGTL